MVSASSSTRHQATIRGGGEHGSTNFSSRRSTAAWLSCPIFLRALSSCR